VEEPEPGGTVPAGAGKTTRITLVPHTHWDREWYLPFEAFRDRLVAMMDGLLELLGKENGFPHFHLDGQAAMIEDYLAVRPEREPDVRRLAEGGRISVGPWFTQMDEFLVSGESLVRNLEWGMARAARFGDRRPVGYLPDQFGHVGQMPQILSSAGIDRAVVWRGVPSTIDRTAFWWESPDGSRVLAEYLVFGYGLGGHLREARDSEALATALRNVAALLVPRSDRDRVLLMVGGDHHGPDPTLPERLRDMAAVAPDLLAVVGPVADHVDGRPPDGLPTWRGEMRSAARAHLLPGVYSTRAHQKRERAEVEALVERYAEPLAALVPGFEWPQAQLDRVWQLLLWNGAHDSVCGCSVDEVARAVDGRHSEARALAEGVVEEALWSLAAQVSAGGVLRFNPSPFERQGVPGLGWAVGEENRPAGTKLPVTVDGGWVDANGVAFTLTDEPDGGDLYNFCPAEGVVATGPRRLAVDGQTVTAEFDGALVRLKVSRRNGERFIRLEGFVRNARSDHRLRLVVALPEVAGGAVAGAPFELAERGLVSEGSGLESPSPTWPARGFVLAGGLAVLAEGVLEYELVDGSAIAVTLLRCVGTISRPSLATRPRPAGPDIPTPGAQMIGETRFSLGIHPGARREELLPAWERFALPLRSAAAPGGGPLPARGQLLRVEAPALSAIRRVDGRVEARVWNPSLGAAAARVGERALSLGPAAIATVALEQEELSPPP
jgi:alpha-mannosidase